MASGETLRRICAADDMPPESTVRGWVIDHEAFSAQYARAREAQAHAIAEKAVAEAEAAPDPQLGRLAFDARKWFASKVAPKHYGDKVTQEHTGPGGGPIEVESPLDRIASRLAGLAARGRPPERTE
jgi:hypothetical protein